MVTARSSSNSTFRSHQGALTHGWKGEGVVLGVLRATRDLCVLQNALTGPKSLSQESLEE